MKFVLSDDGYDVVKKGVVVFIVELMKLIDG